MNRVARARAVLQAAEQRHGVTALTLVKAAPNKPQDKPARLTPAIAAGPTRTAESSGPGPLLNTGHRPAFGVPEALQEVLPQGLPRGAVCTVAGSTTVLLALVAQVTRQGGWVAFVGTWQINFVAAQDLGMDLAQVAVIPQVGELGPEIMATLVDGMDLVVVGPGVGLTHRQQGRLSARARERGTTLLTAGPWQGARVQLHGQPGPWQGAHHGLGRLTSCQYQIQDSARGHNLVRGTVQLRSDGFHRVAPARPVALVAQGA